MLVTDLGLDPTQVARARALVTAQLAAWRINGETRHATVLLVSELVTNALRHGRPPIRLVATSTPSGVRVEVYDGDGDMFPTIQDTRPDDAGGRGLRLVDALADRWGTIEDTNGKCVWFEIDVKEQR